MTFAPTSPERLLTHLHGLGIKHTTRHHDAVMTVEHSKSLTNDIPGLRSKNLFLNDGKGGLWLVVVEQDFPVNLKTLRKRLGLGNLSFAKPELLFEVLGVQPGSVTPFAVINDVAQRVTLVLDQALADGALVSFHPLINTQTTTISGADLLIFLRDVSHEPVLIDFATI